jgi:hypothetical protein
MEPAQFKSLVESVSNFMMTGDLDPDLTIAEELVGDYLDNCFGLNEDVSDDDIENALLAVLGLAEAIEYVIEKRDRSAAGLSSKMYHGEYDADQGYDKHMVRGPKVADAAHKVAKKKYGNLAGNAMRSRAKRQQYEDEYGTGGKDSAKNKAKIKKLNKFIKRRTGQNPGDGRGDKD